MTTKDTGVKGLIKALHPTLPGIVEGLQGGFMEMFQDKVPLDELKATLDLALGPGSFAKDDLDAQAGYIVFEVRYPSGISRFKLAAFIAEDLFRQSVAHEGPVKASENIDFEGFFDPASGQQIAGAVVLDHDEVAVADPGEANLSHEVDLPEVVSSSSLKAGDGFDGR